MQTRWILTAAFLCIPALVWSQASDRRFTVEYEEPTDNAGGGDTAITSVGSGLVITQTDADGKAIQEGTGEEQAKRFVMEEVVAGTYRLKSALNDWCLSVPGSSTTQSVQLTFEPCVEAATNQQWLVGASPTTLRPVHNQTMCADIAGASQSPGAKIQQFGCHGGTNQAWTYTATGTKPLDDLAGTNIYVDVISDGDKETKTMVPATAKTGGGTISKRFCQAIKDLSTAETINVQVTAFDESGNESDRSERVVWPVAGNPDCTPIVSENCAEGDFITDKDKHEWTLGPNNETLRDGVHTAGGTGTPYLYANDVVYVKGGTNWYRYDGPTNSWVNVGQTKPDCSTVVPIEMMVTHNAADMDPDAPGLQFFGGTEVTYAGDVADEQAISWEWLYTINGGPETVFSSGAALPVEDVVFTYPIGPKTYDWILRGKNASGGVGDSRVTVDVIAKPGDTDPPAAPTGLTILPRAPEGVIINPSPP